MPKTKPRITAKTRKVLKLGGSLVITLPSEFVKAHNIKQGDDIPVLANHILKVVPMAEE